jgi:hypothetical protein
MAAESKSETKSNGLMRVRYIGLEEGWKHIKEDGLNELFRVLESGIDGADTSTLKKRRMDLYTTCYNMCK